MPIRIEKDPEKDPRRNNRPERGRRPRPNIGGRGGIGGGGLIGTLLPFLFKRPKLLILGAILLAVWYFGFRGGSSVGGETVSNIGNFGLGANFNPKIYDQAKVFEPLADNKKNPMPEKVTLLKYAPSRKNQGRQGSCVAWASAYGARTIMQARATNQNPNDVAFSPAFLYNQIALEGCQGSFIRKAMELMKNKGSVPFSKFGYTDQDCSRTPNPELFADARKYPINGYNRLTKGGDNHATDLLAIKQNLAQGAPVVIGMMVGGTFMGDMRGKSMWQPTQSDYNNMNRFGGHAMCVIGYDDYYKNNRGAFQIMNSWGEEWGDKGIFWMDYQDFDAFTREAYGLFPMGDASKPISKVEKIELGLVKNEGGYIPLQKTGEMTFTSSQKVNKQTRFKIEVGNTKECYIYVFGQETDNSTYTLFPYTAKHSPYCGITGTRVFPRDHSLYVDDLGNKDYFAVIVSNQPLQFDKVNQALSNSSATKLTDKIKDVFQGELNQYQGSTNGQTVNLSFEFNKPVSAMVIEIEK